MDVRGALCGATFSASWYPYMGQLTASSCTTRINAKYIKIDDLQVYGADSKGVSKLA